MRKGHSTIALAVVSVLALGVTAAALARAQASKLNGTVGPGYTISLKQNGKKVKTLKAGSYTFVISDKARIHDFVIEKEKGKGKGFEKELSHVSQVGTTTTVVKLTPGTWKYYCKPHESMMFGFFTVT